jgi:hypothetical protein
MSFDQNIEAKNDVESERDSYGYEYSTAPHFLATFTSALSEQSLEEDQKRSERKFRKQKHKETPTIVLTAP